MKKILLSLAAATLLAAPAMAESKEITFSYSPEQATLYGWGLDQTITYDVAIKVKNPSFEGYKITGMYVPFTGHPTYVTRLEGWLSSKLEINSLGNNVPDIKVKEASLADGVLSVTFDEPYTITKDGIYVGYSFTVTTSSSAGGTCYPVQYTSPCTDPDAFYVHTANESSWKSLVSEFLGGVASAITVRLSGEFYDDGCFVNMADDYYLEAGKSGEIEVSFGNDGANVLRDLEYTLTVNGKTETGTVSLDLPLAPMVGNLVTKKIPVSPIAETGVYAATLEVTKANGKTNGSADKSATADIHIVPFIPVNRPLVEEFTALWCSNCPRGFVALETLNEEYGDLFTAASYHGTDAMTVTNSYPGPVSSFPSSWINRTGPISDPIYLAKEFTDARISIPTVEIKADLVWNDDDHTSVKAISTVRFVEDLDNADYKIGYLLLGDDMSDESWLQANAYSGTPDSTLTGKWWEIFTKGDKYVRGLEYNDVVLGYEYALGVENSLPATIKGGDPLTHSCEYGVESIKCITNNENIPFDKNKVRVLAFVIDKNGQVMNTVSSGYPSENIGHGVAEVEDAAVVAVRYYDLAGRMVSNPERGIYVKAETLSDGSVRTSKVVKK